MLRLVRLTALLIDWFAGSLELAAATAGNVKSGRDRKFPELSKLITELKFISIVLSTIATQAIVSLVEGRLNWVTSAEVNSNSAK